MSISLVLPLKDPGVEVLRGVRAARVFINLSHPPPFRISSTPSFVPLINFQPSETSNPIAIFLNLTRSDLLRTLSETSSFKSLQKHFDPFISFSHSSTTMDATISRSHSHVTPPSSTAFLDPAQAQENFSSQFDLEDPMAAISSYARYAFPDYLYPILKCTY